LQVTQLKDFCRVDYQQVQDRLIASLAKVLGYRDRYSQVGETLPGHGLKD